MSFYTSRLIPKVNSSFSLCSGNAMTAEVVRVKRDTFLVNAGLGRPRHCKADELTRISYNPPARFDSLVGFQGVVPREPPARKWLLERFFVKLVTGEPMTKEQAAARARDLVGSTEIAEPGEPPLLLLPRPEFRQEQALMELQKQKFRNIKRFFLAYIF